jgi:TetR/AcrR family transcriptional regulator, transcriptional repressor for nem operon
MKVSKEQAEQNRSALLDAASRLYRKHGFDGVGVAQIAREAGLTHGSLYGHFESKEHYAAEACARAFVLGLSGIRQVEIGDEAALSAFFKDYLSERHRDDFAEGCTVAALACETARKDGPVSSTMTRGIETFVKLLCERMSDTFDTSGALDAPDATDAEPNAAVHDRALVTLSMMVGGLILSRASAQANPDLSKQVLNAVLGTIEAQDA